jgi:hypothetical protein
VDETHVTNQSLVELGRRRRIALGLRMWRSGEEGLARITLVGVRDRYERAIDAALRTLPDDQDMASLLSHYCERGGAVDTCVREACLSADPHGRLASSIVRNTAYWRRLRSLIGARCA